jgi:hypothetical protein
MDATNWPSEHSLALSTETTQGTDHGVAAIGDSPTVAERLKSKEGEKRSDVQIPVNELARHLYRPPPHPTKHPCLRCPQHLYRHPKRHPNELLLPQPKPVHAQPRNPSRLLRLYHEVTCPHVESGNVSYEEKSIDYRIKVNWKTQKDFSSVINGRRAYG